MEGRNPPGVRGLKLLVRSLVGCCCLRSHPTRGAWIEIFLRFGFSPSLILSHPTRGAWIEIARHGQFCAAAWSHPTRGAWIEILLRLRFCVGRRKSHPARGAWIEIAHSHRGLYLHQSHLTWCARNEILTLSLCNSKSDVTRFAGVRINVMWKPSLWIWRNTFVPCSLHRCLASLTIWVRQPLTAAAFQLKSVLHKPKDDFLSPQYACFGNSRLLYGLNSFLFCGRLFLSRCSIFRSERTSPARTAVFVLLCINT